MFYRRQTIVRVVLPFFGMHYTPALIQGGLGEVWRLAPQSSVLIKELLQRLGVTVIDWYSFDDDEDDGG